MSESRGAIVRPELFTLLRAYITAIEDGSVRSGRSVPESSKAITFLQSFFEQFFNTEFHIEIRAFDGVSKREVVAWRHDHPVGAERGPIVASFEELCDLFVDVIGAGYGGGSVAVFHRFHIRFLPTLLERIVLWASSNGHHSLLTEASACQSALQEAIVAANW